MRAHAVPLSGAAGRCGPALPAGSPVCRAALGTRGGAGAVAAGGCEPGARRAAPTASSAAVLPACAAPPASRWCRRPQGRGAAVCVSAAAPVAAVPVLPATAGALADKYRFVLSNGGMVFTAVEPRDQELVVTVSVPAESLPSGAQPMLQWGMYRAPGGAWQHPADLVPSGSTRDGASGAMRSPLAYDKRRDVWEQAFRVKRRMAPLQLAFTLHLPDMGTTLGPARGGDCVVPVGMAAGRAEPLGPSLVEVTAGSGPDATATLNFAVFSRHAAGMSLCILRRDGSGYLEVGLDPAIHRSGDVWHVQLQGLRAVRGLLYGWRATGDKTWADGGAFHAAYIMLDPYCPRALPVTLPQAAYDAAPLLPPQGRLPGPVLLGSLAFLTEDFDWGAGPPRGPAIPLEDSVLLEIDVADFTSGPSAERLVPPEHRGTYLGLIDRLPDITASGATAVVLSNVFLSSLTAAPPPEPDADGAAPSVAWPTDGGRLRRPLSFIAPEVALAAGDDPSAAAGQLKAVIAALHAAGMEVLLEAEFCLTAEVAGGSGGRLQSIAGLDGDMYVRGGGGPRARGVLNTGQPVVRRLLRDALRHWLAEFRVDGFVLVHAENLAQDATGAVWDSPAALEELAADPLLRGAKLIAAGGDGGLLPRAGERGVPHYGVLAEWNLRFARDISALLKDNAGGHLSSLATRLMGSPDLTAARWDSGLPGGLAAGRRPGFSINALAPPGGPALLSLAGGDWDLERGEVVARSMLLALAVAQGTPALGGSVLARAGLRRFAAAALQLRRKYRHLLAPPLLDSPRDITWHDVSASWEPDWSGEAAASGTFAANYIGFSVRGTSPGTDGAMAAASVQASAAAAAAAPPAAGAASAAATAKAAGVVAAAKVAAARQQSVYVGFNPNPEPVTITLPPPPEGLQWRRLIDTSRLPPEDAVPEGAESLFNEYILAPGAALMLDAAPQAAAPQPAPGQASAAARASQVYERMGQA